MNTLTGQGIEQLGFTAEVPTNLPTGDTLTDWEQEGFLQVGRAQLIVENEVPSRIRYQSLLLDLGGFYQLNAGTQLPPQSCFNPALDPTYNPDHTAVPDFLNVVGESPFYEQPVYLDKSSIQAMDDNTYRYELLIGLVQKQAESELMVDCNQPNQVQVVRVRYYDENNQVREVEEVNEWHEVNANPPNNAQYRAHQAICNAGNSVAIEDHF